MLKFLLFSASRVKKITLGFQFSNICRCVSCNFEMEASEGREDGRFALDRRYSKVFQYLLRLKRIQLELEKSWAEAMHFDRADSRRQRKDPVNGSHAWQRQQLRMPMWRVRQHMTYLITNLQFYIQVRSLALALF